MMICYRDRTFCESDCSRWDCPRFVSDETLKAAQRAKLPLALSDFSKNCDDYIPGTTK